MIEIIDNFLNNTDLKCIKNEMLHGNFNWFYCNNSLLKNPNFKGKKEPMFQHTFVKDYKINSDKLSLLDKLIEKINQTKKPKKYIKIKSNLYMKCNKKTFHKSHVDFPNLNNYTTSIYYLTTTNGYTKVGNKKVKDKENRIVFFDGNTKHNASIQTDKEERLLININYE